MDNTYLAHFGLVEEPYSTSPNPRYLYIYPTHNLALEKTKWTITSKRGLSLVFGPVGTGKTTLARELAQRLEENPSVSYVFITNPNFPTPNQLLRAINQEFEVPQSAKSLPRPAQHLQKLPDDAGVHPAEDPGADHRRGADPESAAPRAAAPADELREQRPKVLAGRPVRPGGVPRPAAAPEIPQSGNRAAMSSTLENLSYAETVAMLRHRWLIAGGKSFPFTEEAIEQIYAYSQGIPRTQVILADNALLAAFVSGAATIGPEIIHEVVKDRGLPDTQPPPPPRSIKKHKAESRISSLRRAGDGR